MGKSAPVSIGLSVTPKYYTVRNAYSLKIGTKIDKFVMFTWYWGVLKKNVPIDNACPKEL